MLGKVMSHLVQTGSLIIRPTMVILASGLLLTGLTVQASAAVTTAAVQQHQDPDNDLVVRRAYMSWLATQQEPGMEATIRYLKSINGSVSRLESLRQEFRNAAAGIPAQESGEGLNGVLQELRIISRQFREETRWILAASGGSNEKLATAVSGVAEGDAWTQMPGDDYWMTLMADEPSSFDRYIHESQATLTVLREHGYDTFGAQECLDQISVMRSEYTAALQSQDYGGAMVIRGKIHDASVIFGKTVKDIRPCDKIKETGPIGGSCGVSDD